METIAGITKIIKRIRKATILEITKIIKRIKKIKIKIRIIKLVSTIICIFSQLVNTRKR